MNAIDVLTYAHGEVTSASDRVPADGWDRPGVCGAWSAKDVISHLTSFEWVLVDVLRAQAGTIATPMLDRFRDPAENFNDSEVARRAGMSAAAVVAEYRDAADSVMALAADLSAEDWRQPGTIPWYGDQYSLDDFVVYAFYGHAREHCAQLSIALDRYR